MTELAHERLDAYKASIDFLAIADEVSGSLPKGRAYLADQLRRAATSIALNIAEGAGEFAAREKARFYRMARRSATECGAVLDVCARLGLGGAAQRLATGKALVHRIVSMLTVLVKRLGVLDSAGTGTGARERGEARSGTGTGTGTGTGGAGRVERVSGGLAVRVSSLHGGAKCGQKYAKSDRRRSHSLTDRAFFSTWIARRDLY